MAQPFGQLKIMIAELEALNGNAKDLADLEAKKRDRAVKKLKSQQGAIAELEAAKERAAAKGQAPPVNETFPAAGAQVSPTQQPGVDLLAGRSAAGAASGGAAVQTGGVQSGGGGGLPPIVTEGLQQGTQTIRVPGGIRQIPTAQRTTTARPNVQSADSRAALQQKAGQEAIDRHAIGMAFAAVGDVSDETFQLLQQNAVKELGQQGARLAAMRSLSQIPQIQTQQALDIQKARANKDQFSDPFIDPQTGAMMARNLNTNEQKVLITPDRNPDGTATMSSINQIHNSFLKFAQPFSVVRRSYESILQSKGQPVLNEAGDQIGVTGTGASDLNLLFSYMKMLDPESVVREGEQALFQSTKPRVKELALMWKRTFSSGEFLDDEQRLEIFNEARLVWNGRAIQHLDTEKTFKQYGLTNGVPPNRTVVTDHFGRLRPQMVTQADVEEAQTALGLEGDKSPATKRKIQDYLHDRNFLFPGLDTPLN